MIKHNVTTLFLLCLLIETGGYAEEHKQKGNVMPHNAPSYHAPIVKSTSTPQVQHFQHTPSMPHQTVSAPAVMHHQQSGTQFRHHEGEHRHRTGGTVIYYPFIYSSPTYYYPTDDSSYVDYSSPPAVETNTISLPEGVWVAASNGDVPENAIEYSVQNGVSIFYCRASYQGNMYYGQLSPNDACVYRDSSVTLRFTSYDVLVSQ